MMDFLSSPVTMTQGEYIAYACAGYIFTRLIVRGAQWLAVRRG